MEAELDRERLAWMCRAASQGPVVLCFFGDGASKQRRIYHRNAERIFRIPDCEESG